MELNCRSKPEGPVDAEIQRGARCLLRAIKIMLLQQQSGQVMEAPGVLRVGRNRSACTLQSGWTITALRHDRADLAP